METFPVGAGVYWFHL